MLMSGRELLKKSLYVPVVLVIGLGVVACSPPPSGRSESSEEALDGDSSGMEPISVEESRVVVDIFSGRTNPSWGLSEAEAATLMTMLDGLEEVEEGSAPSEQLGCRQFVVTLANPAANASQMVSVYDTTVEVDHGDEVKYYTDTDGQFGRWLLESGKAHLDEDLYTVVEEAVMQPSP
ncbi:MAG: hypothetical protein GFH27_549281n311 [Chloroflexi bacterium AL-W]|nr:hypothetical protein [Chloroflexi bacterium AL-N1]NOK66196.1 hypothetical protein [Chloroflexi bacterium AL-N10]NOK73077.1 hypothetical protein [Chloroflexi bacterium AL-N5]NOK79974.1 hypothetical protein [Chloroflexi bacterium AL-W]NOK88170.1 hypothetical protein [Chloroflexi bacterium AL-N15]